MSQQYDNSGGLWRNDRKERDTHPTHTGSITVEGREYWLSAWVKEGRNGKYFSLSVKPKEQHSNGYSQPANEPDTNNDFDDDIPF